MKRIYEIYWILGQVMNEQWPDRKAGQKVKACAGKLFSVLIFCFFFIKEKEEALRGD
jgi:hypothetical protein